MPFVTRFAPSPTGYLHLGHAMSAAIGWWIARRTGGRWLLRIEDIDTGRSRPEFVQAIMDDLGWLGLVPDAEPLLQTSRAASHAQALDDLRERGLLYPCICTRADIERAALAAHAGESSLYPGTCKHNPPDAATLARLPHALRLDLDAAGLPRRQQWRDLAKGVCSGRADIGGDPVLARKDGGPSYHLACVLDDSDSGVTLVVRGEDLEEATPLQRLLQQLLAVAEPAYLHHPLLLDAEGRRLAKRDHAATLAARRTKGGDGPALRDQLLRQAAPLLMAAGTPIA